MSSQLPIHHLKYICPQPNHCHHVTVVLSTYILGFYLLATYMTHWAKRTLLLAIYLCPWSIKSMRRRVGGDQKVNRCWRARNGHKLTLLSDFLPSTKEEIRIPWLLYHVDHRHGALKLNKLNILFVVLKRCVAYGTTNLRVNNTHQKVYKKLPHMKETREA